MSPFGLGSWRRCDVVAVGIGVSVGAGSVGEGRREGAGVGGGGGEVCEVPLTLSRGVGLMSW